MVLACASRKGAVYEISPLTTVDDLERLRPEWTALFESSRVPNPFAHPDWLISWAQHFADPFDLYVLAVRSGNELVGVAPFFRRSVSLVGGRVTCLRMLGGGRNSKLTEMPQILTAPRQSRRILRALVGHLCANAGDWDWVEIELGLTQGWFEREWIPMHGVGSGSVPIHKGARAFVVLPLAPTWEVQRAPLKRKKDWRSSRRARSRDEAPLQEASFRPHGPDVSKLRWSEEIRYAPSFLLVGERRRSRFAFAAFWHLRAEYMRRDQRRRHIGRKRPAEFPELEAPQHAPPAALPEFVLD